MTGAPVHAGAGPRRGSARPLLVVALVFLVLFAWQRSRSTVLQIEAKRHEAARLAEVCQELDPGLRTADVMALHDLCGVAADRAVWTDCVNRFLKRVDQARQMLDLGGLVPLAPGGPVSDRLAAMAVRDMTGDDLAVRRFLILRERFADR